MKTSTRVRLQQCYHSNRSTNFNLIILVLFLLLFTATAIDNEDTGNDKRRQQGIGKTDTITDDGDTGTCSSLKHCCECHKDFDDDEHDGGARIAYLITLHNTRTLQDAVPLFQKIIAPGTIILIHIDIKLAWDEYETSELKRIIDEECLIICQDAKVLVERKFDVKWGTWSMNEPTLWSMKELVTNPIFADQWDVYINLSADSLPVYSPKIMSKLFSPVKMNSTSEETSSFSLYGINFVTSSSCITGLLPTSLHVFPKKWHKRMHYTTTSKGKFHGDKLDIVYYEDSENNQEEDPQDTNADDSSKSRKSKSMITHFGSQWMILSPSFISYIVRSMNEPTSLPSVLKQRLVDMKKLMTDETFFPTLLMNQDTYRVPEVLEDGSLAIMPSIKAIRYERMDENHPTAFGDVFTNQRYEVPDSLSEQVDTPKPWGPYYLGAYDLANIRDSGALFIRKVTKDVDPNLLHLLPVSKREDIPRIQWPDEVKIGNKPKWDHFG